MRRSPRKPTAQFMSTPRRDAVWKKAGGCCVYCLAELYADRIGPTPVRRLPMDIEHAVPRTRGGSNKLENCLPACSPCNSRKSVRTVGEYLAAERRRTGQADLVFHPAAMAFVVDGDA